MNCYPFIEAEKAQRRNVKRACELLKVSRAACHASRADRPPDRDRAPRRRKKTTIADPAATARADAIRRDFTADAAKINTRWCSDITCIATREGWLYLAAVTGIASRRAAGFALCQRPTFSWPWTS